MRPAIRTLAVTVAASLGLHGCFVLFAATAMTVLPELRTPGTRPEGEVLKLARPFKAGDKYLLASRIEQSLDGAVPQPGRMLVHLQGLWEIQEVTPLTGQPGRYTLTVSECDIVTSEGTGALFKPGTVIAAAVNEAGVEIWTLDGAPADGPMRNLLRQALPPPTVRDDCELAAIFQPKTPVKTGAAWTPNLAAAGRKLAAEGFTAVSGLTGSLTLSEPMDWGEIPGREISGSLTFQSGAVPALPGGSVIKAAALVSEAALILPDDPALPVVREKWTTTCELTAQLPGMTEAGKVSAVMTVERELGLFVEEEEAEAQEVQVTFVPQEEMPRRNPKVLKPTTVEEKEEKQPGPSSPPRQVFILAREDQPVISPLAGDSPFISSRDMRAASNSAPDANADPRIPNQEGAEMPGLSLFNRMAMSGSITPQPRPAPAPEPVRQPPTPPEPPEPKKDERPPDPSATVQTEDPNSPAAQKTPALRERPPDPIAMNQVPPRPPARTSPAPPQVPVEQSTKGLTNGPKPVVSNVKTRTRGGLAITGGDSSVDAKDTPEGRYLAACHERIGLIWNSRLAMNSGIAGTGSVEVEFEIDISGRVSNVKLTSPGSANPVFEDICLTSVIKAKLPALPPSMKRQLEDPLTGGKLHRKVSFHRL